MSSSLASEAFANLLARAIEGHPERLVTLRDQFAVGQAIIERWARGLSRPHPLLQEEVEDYIRKTWSL